jgi:hypothetical protein
VRLQLAGWLRLQSNDSFFNPTEIIKQTKQHKMKIETLETDESEVNSSKVVLEAEWLVARKDVDAGKE